MDSRSSSGFVGLRNGGATCYMNAVFQQLYMQPGLPEVTSFLFSVSFHKCVCLRTVPCSYIEFWGLLKLDILRDSVVASEVCIDDIVRKLL